MIGIYEENFKVIAKLTTECTFLKERDASDQDMEVWRQTVRERYPAEGRRLLFEVRQHLY